jgi:hypothetical protein
MVSKIHILSFNRFNNQSFFIKNNLIIFFIPIIRVKFIAYEEVKVINKNSVK